MSSTMVYSLTYDLMMNYGAYIGKTFRMEGFSMKTMMSMVK